MSEFNPKSFETKWQEHWEKTQSFKVGAPGEKKFYCLDMFPYPSGTGLHIGHPLGYTATDIYSRFKRMNGFSVLHPMGYDAFGLPAEQHAVNTGEHPAIITEKNCDIFTTQMKKIGLSYDWSRELKTCTPDYYKWTQWIFLKLYNSWFDEATQKARPITELKVPADVSDKGELAVEAFRAQHRLAYYADAMVNWCPALGTVLANEEVIDGKSERGGHEVIRKPMKQWILRITKYAERLISELEDINWPEAIKEQQRNWIGKKTGAEIDFQIAGSDRCITAFTTRPDTLFGVTFFVIAPEHPLASEVTKADQKDKVQRYIDDASKMSEFARTVENRKKTGVLTGGHVVNPITNEKVPVYIGDYVLASYGTGAVMGVPAHDDRDFEFARTFQIDIRPVLAPQNESPEITTAILEGELAFTASGKMIVSQFPVAKELKLEGKQNNEAKELITDWLIAQNKGRRVINYKLRDWLFSRQRYWGEPIPIIHWEDGMVSSLEESDLPLVLPQVEDYKPSDGGESPLAKAKDWLSVTCAKTGKKGRRETNTMPQWAGSCWYYLRFIDPKNDKAPWDPKLEKGWMNVDLYVGGAEHAVLHLLYARFWHKVLYDLGYVSTREPFQRLYNQGMILAFAYKNKRGALIPVDEVKENEDGTIIHQKTGDSLERIVAKMSKSLKNVINPDVVIDEFGADTLRMYLMFMGPLDMARVWDSKAINGNFRFLKRTWTYFTEGGGSKASFVPESQESQEVLKAVHLAVQRVTEDLENLRFNTGISALMECLNAISSGKLSRTLAEMFLKLLSPYAPHTAEELWEQIGNTQVISLSSWPAYNEAFLKQDAASVVIQVNGKKRALIEVDIAISEDALKSEVTRTLSKTEYKLLGDEKIITVYVSGTKIPKLVNIIAAKKSLAKCVVAQRICYTASMTQAEGSHNRIRDFLKSVTSFSIIDSGIVLASSGGIVESNRSGSCIRGIVKDGEATFTVSLDILTSADIDAQCTCCSDEDMAEFWCHHAVALLWSACDLGFLDAASGFESSESTIRMNMSSPQEIARVILDLNHIEYTAHAVPQYHPMVTILIECSSDRLGVQVKFDDETQEHTFFELGKRVSSRALDNILLKLLDDEGSWDDMRKLWYVNSSKGIETVLGIIQEYEKVLLIDNPKKKVSFSRDFIEGQLIIKWLESSADIAMRWVLPDGTIVERVEDLIGTGPFWTVVDACVYRLSPAASKVSSIFPYSKSINLPRQQIGPILEEIRTGVYNESLIHVENPDLQPESEVKDPTPKLAVSMKDTRSEHFVSSEKFELDAILDFDYPTPPKNKNIVYLPNRERERELTDFLKSIGFSPSSERSRYVISGDDALDLIQAADTSFEKPWLVSGLDVLKDRIKFADLSLQISVTKSPEGKKGSSHWFDCHIALTQNKSNIPISTLFKPSRIQTERWIRLDSGAYARIPGGNLNQLKTTLGMVDPGFKLSNTIKAKLGTGQAVSIGRFDDKSVVLNLDSKLKDLQQKLTEFQTIDPVKVQKGFHGKLRSYQEEGMSWINFLDDYELGGILADEMGLGKTVQTLAFLQHLKVKRGGAKNKKPYLIVAPTSVITNWCYEIKRFVPDMTYLMLQGPQRKLFFKDIPKVDIVITSYALLRLDKPELEKFEFEYFILDEAQNIKNPSAAISKAAKAIPSRRRIALTGTPTENRPLELWSIIDFVMPGYLGSEDFFRTHIEKPILEGASPQQAVKFLNAKTRPFILRRTKAEVEKDLPPKIESVVHVEMTASQVQLYGQVLEEVRPKVLDAIDKKGVGGASVSILAALLRLRQICNHPNSIEALKGLAGFESGKFNLLKDLVTDALENGRKILVFSQFREMLAIIRRWLDAERVNHLYLDGTTKDRQGLIDTFNTDESVRLFLISLKAGGTGLNLTAADTVIIYDPWWNPAVESQAVDRAHRIGQTKAVSVYRLVTEDSVEQKIMDLKSKKSKVVDALINDNGLSTLKLSKMDIVSLFAPLQQVVSNREEEEGE